MWYKHIQVTIAFVFFTIATLCMIPVSFLTGHSDEYKLADVFALYKTIADDIYSK